MGRREADRVAAAQAAAQRQAQEDATAQRTNEQRQRIDRHVAEAAGLIPQALAALAARDHEGVVLVKVYAKRLPPLRWFVGSTRTVDIAGYPLTTSQVGETSRHGAETRQIYLLRDGRLMWSTPPSSYPIGILGQVETALRSICDEPTPA